MSLPAALVQTQWARLVLATLQQSGVATIVVSPGSRSAPLAVAAAQLHDRVEVVVIIDERSAGFYALGAARATGRPAALICTSGTAAAHYFPALIEAASAYVPLVVITADRPAELHYCGAPQTIDQRNLFGSFTRASFLLGTPDATALALRGCRRTVAQAVALATGALPGPVHLNVPLRKPLEPAIAHNPEEQEFVRFSDTLAAHTPVLAPPVLVAAIPATVLTVIKQARSGLIAVGNTPAYSAGLSDAVAALATATGFAVVAESGSQVRHAGRCVGHHDALTMSAARDRLAPDVILQIGGELASSGWIAARVAWANAATIIFDSHGIIDPHSQASAVVIGNLVDALREVTRRIDQPDAQHDQPTEHTATRAACAAQWHALDTIAAAAIETVLLQHPDSEAGMIKAAMHALPQGAGLLLGNSLPIRVVDQITAPTADRRRWIVTQRGANGIDGLLAGAAGAVHARGRAMLLVGDVSFAHDIGSLALLRSVTQPLAIVVLDNGGGRIFDTLPIANTPDCADAATLMANFFTTAPGFDAVAVTRAFGITTVETTTTQATHLAVRAAFERASATVIVVRCSSDGAQAVQRAVLDHINTSLRSQPQVEKS
ncbi:MAG: 2-succinyl-5-enolpyruvyl-6-hydroxy-3-cyclohexene-1-carboxylic-acid synthase [Kofleriaceae bacterium]|nr:2-succinyl-5-enolpyruvyl-6-hydroxy-3-cyclohexene-1-carboxylic-acid synthase [Kofleriaceae bacterium]